MPKTSKAIVWIIVIALVVWGIVAMSKGRKEPVTVEPIKIGAILTLTGPAASYGEATKRGIDVAFKEAREKYPNLSFETTYGDSKFDPKEGVTAYNSLKAKGGVDAVITQASSVALAVEPIAKSDGVLQMAVAASGGAYDSPNDLSFRTTGTTANEAKTTVDYIDSKFSSVAIIYMNNEIGVSISDEVNRQISESPSTKVVLKEAFPADIKDFKPILLKLKASGAQSVYFAGLSNHFVVFLKQAGDLKVSLPVVGFRTAEDKALIRDAGKLAEGLVFTSAFDASSVTGVAKTFVDDFMASYGESPDNFSAEAYVGARLVIEAFAKCGKDTPCIQSYLGSLKDYDSVFGRVSVNEFGDVTYPYFLKIVKNGEFVKLK